jgi:hypothetical protein
MGGCELDIQGHCTPVNKELGTFRRSLYQEMVFVSSHREVARFWDHLALKQYIDEDSFQEVVARMFWLSIVSKF